MAARGRLQALGGPWATPRCNEAACAGINFGRPGTRWPQPELQHLSFDGTILFSNRHARIAEDAGLSREQGDTQLGQLKAPLKALVASLGKPLPYLAVIAADGDHMGKTLDSLETANAHRKFSQELAQFAQEAGRIVKDYCGVAIYTGGDDVLALMPVDNALNAARELRKMFIETVAPPSEKPTLSIGVAIGHFMEPLEDLRAFATAAEQHAKRPRLEELDQLTATGLPFMCMHEAAQTSPSGNAGGREAIPSTIASNAGPVSSIKPNYPRVCLMKFARSGTRSRVGVTIKF